VPQSSKGWKCSSIATNERHVPGSHQIKSSRRHIARRLDMIGNSPGIGLGLTTHGQTSSDSSTWRSLACEFRPTIGAEIQKTRPALIIQNDIGNRVSPITIVAAITSTLKQAYPFQVFLKCGEAGLDVDSVVTLNHIRSIDRQRLVRRLGAVGPTTMQDVERAILVSFGIR
jgi:mRNA interferase MazF